MVKNSRPPKASGHDGRSPVPVTVPAPPIAKGNLPLSVDSFVGREAEVAEVAEALQSSRLLTLTGPAGVGKTRLALETAANVASQYPDGAWVATLAPVADPALVAQAVATALSLQEQPGRPWSDRLVAHLRRRRLLLVVDNAEHVTKACGALVGLLLESCPDVALVVTSREPLGVDGEHVVPVATLGVPADPGAGPEAVAASPAARLFCDRAAAFRPGFALDAASAPSVAEICRRLDGIPLALELAAARVTVLAPAEIAGRLDDRFALLTTGNRTGLAHHQTLRATLDWSYDLLTDAEATLLRRLSVFAGGAPLEAVAEVCAGGGIELEGVEQLVESLVSRSLLVANRQGPTPRYRLLESLSVYGRERLVEAGEADGLGSRHASWYLGFAERLDPQLTGTDQPGALARVDAEHDNLRTALTWALTNDPASGLRLAGAMSLYWRLRGHYSEGAAFLSTALASSGSAPAGVKAKALWGAGLLALLQGALSSAVELLEECLDLWRELGDEEGCARATLLLGNALSDFGDNPEKRQQGMSLLEESTALARRTGDGWCLAHALALRGRVLHFEGELDAAALLLEESVLTARRHNDAQGLRIGLLVLTTTRLAQGAYSSAEDLLWEGLALAQTLGEPYGVEVAWSGLAEAAAGRGDYGRARELLARAIDLSREAGQPRAVFIDLCALGRIVSDEGDATTALALFQEAIEVAQGRSDVHDAPAALGVGRAEADLGHTTAAERWLEQALASATSTGDQRSVSTSLHELGNLARATGNTRRAASLHEDALRNRLTAGRLPELVESVEAMAGSLTDLGRYDEATRLFGSAQAARDSRDLLRPPRCRSAYEADVARAKTRLGAARFETLLRQGAELSPAEAFLRLSTPRRGNRPSFGWESLTGAQRAVAALVSEGLSNAEVAQRLYISPGTVRVHLTSVFAKLGITSRSELPKETIRRES